MTFKSAFRQRVSKRVLALIPALALVTASLVMAAGEGRMIGTVVDSDGNPVEGV